MRKFKYNGIRVKDRGEIPEDIKELYKTSPEISPESHVGMQAAFQEYCDSGISKTINFANDATIEDVHTAYIDAWKSGCKGITVYRAGSRDKEVLVTAHKTENNEQLNFFDEIETPISDEYFFAECCDSPRIAMESGCRTCKSCGWSACYIA